MNIGLYVVPIFLLMTFGMALWNKTAAFDDFVNGAKEGIGALKSIVPNLIGMIVATKVFLASGIVDTLTNWMRPFWDAIGVDATVLPLMILRPLSGAASLSYASEIIQLHGPDSQAGRLASVLQAGGDTTIYIITLYFAAVGIKRMKQTLNLGIFVDIVSFALAIFFVKLFF